MTSKHGLLGDLFELAGNERTRLAVVTPEREVSYGELCDAAGAICAALRARPDADTAFAAVLGNKSPGAYAGVLGVLASGRGYVPLHPGFPAARTRDMLERAGTRLLVVDEDAAASLDALLALQSSPLTILTPVPSAFEAAKHRWPDHDWVDASRFSPGAGAPQPVSAEDFAYLLFTSGSTGTPKGVAITHGNACRYVESALKTWPLGPGDRCSQVFDLGFDLSVHDLFVTWSSGATLYPLSRRALVNPGFFVRKHALTAWFSVPSVANLMLRMRQLPEGSLPSLRTSLFCGEALPETTAAAWSAAAPDSSVENLYGPTEATIAITHHPYGMNGPAPRAPGGLVPIGRPLPEQRAALVDAELRVLEGEARGELLLAGSQVSPGYWRDPAQTRERFVELAGLEPGPWYRTGDIVERDAAGVLHFVGRSDDQIQLRGHRVELGEVSERLRRVTGDPSALVLAWPVGEDGVEGLTGVHCAADAPPDSVLLARLARELPDYMVPSRIVRLEAMPLGPSGKVDRAALRRRLDTRRGAS